MRGTRNGQELGEALNDTEDDRLEQVSRPEVGTLAGWRSPGVCDEWFQRQLRMAVLNAGQPPLVRDQGEQGAVAGAGEHFYAGQPVDLDRADCVGAPRHAVGERSSETGAPNSWAKRRR